jgi:nickel transport protein
MKLAVSIIAAAIASGHELELTYEVQSKSVVVRGGYAGNEPCAYAPVLIYSPADSKSEYQNGRTDAKGFFAFVPDVPGVWKFTIDDELGHRKELAIPIGAVSRTQSAGAVPMAQKALTGVAFLVGVSGFLYGWKARRSR